MFPGETLFLMDLQIFQDFFKVSVLQAVVKFLLNLSLTIFSNLFYPFALEKISHDLDGQR